MRINSTDERAISLIGAIQQGETKTLRRILEAEPALATATLTGQRGEGRSLLHIATDWPGQFPNVAETIALLAAMGADVDAKLQSGPHDETPLHWAASSDDTAAVAALLDAGADIEAPGAVFTRGAPMSDAVIFAKWGAAKLLLARGAKTTLTESAALGLLDRLAEALETGPTPDCITKAFWHACRGGQLGAAERLLGAGANLNWVGWDDQTPLDAAAKSANEKLIAWLLSQGARHAAEVQ
jgi:ankyrin repeat protein